MKHCQHTRKKSVSLIPVLYFNILKGIESTIRHHIKIESISIETRCRAFVLSPFIGKTFLDISLIQNENVKRRNGHIEICFVCDVIDRR